MFEYAIEFGTAVKADNQLPGSLFAGLDFNAGTEFFANPGFQARDIRIARRRLHLALFLCGERLLH